MGQVKDHAPAVGAEARGQEPPPRPGEFEIGDLRPFRGGDVVDEEVADITRQRVVVAAVPLLVDDLGAVRRPLSSVVIGRSGDSRVRASVPSMFATVNTSAPEQHVPNASVVPSGDAA